MDELKRQAEALGIDVDGRWSEVTLRERIAEARATATVLPTPEPPMFPVRLLKHYSPLPSVPYRVVGDPPPPPYPGVGFERKLWAGTVVELPLDVAKGLIENEQVASEFIVDGDGRKVLDEFRRPMTREKRRKFPLAERADPYPMEASR